MRLGAHDNKWARVGGEAGRIPLHRKAVVFATQSIVSLGSGQGLGSMQCSLDRLSDTSTLSTEYSVLGVTLRSGIPLTGTLSKSMERPRTKILETHDQKTCREPTKSIEQLSMLDTSCL